MPLLVSLIGLLVQVLANGVCWVSLEGEENAEREMPETGFWANMQLTQFYVLDWVCARKGRGWWWVEKGPQALRRLAQGHPALPQILPSTEGRPQHDLNPGSYR